MERSLHRELKDRYGPRIGGRSEVVVGAYRVDAIDPEGRLVEIQSAPLGRLRGKLDRLLPDHEVVVVRPVVVARRIIRRDRAEGPDREARRSPKRGSLLDAFDDLIELARIFPNSNLRIDLLAVDVDEIRAPRRRKPGYLVVDRLLREVRQTVPLRVSADLWSLLPDDLPDRFTTGELARAIGRSDEFARRVAYCLRMGGAAEVVAKRGNSRVFERPAALIA
ncbi:hypothetical protein P12x_005172 [Tundrisphaera lichenicola]|uniref:hypothetical protein n=1 Tax=Tundrisphaera lichenicola TaxID=2029860 RepID=UPI003EBF2409